MPLFIDECYVLTGAYKNAGCGRLKAASPADSEATSRAGHEETGRHFNNQPLHFTVSVQAVLAY